VPYRVDLTSPPADALDRLISLGALDVETVESGIAALLPDAVPAEQVAALLDSPNLVVSPAVGRDDDSVWILTPRPMTVGGLSIVPVGATASPGALRLVNGRAFGSGLHATTALCLEVIRDLVDTLRPERVLDVGTGNGVLALAALMMGVPHATGIDIDGAAIAEANENARINGLTERLQLIAGGPDSVSDRWPLVVANVLAAPLVEMAPTLVQRVAHGGRLVLSGMPPALVPEVERTYRRLGMRRPTTDSRAGWAVLALDPSW
jgi:ribosomal protein L11 methyltransferase